MNFGTAFSIMEQVGGFKQLVAGVDAFETAKGREEAAHAGRMQQQAQASSGMSGVIVAVVGVAMVAILAAAIFITKQRGACQNDKEAQFEDQTQEQEATTEGETKEDTKEEATGDEDTIGAHTEEKIDLEDNTNPFEDNSAPTEAV
jgi:flagellar biosynthesis/type III secretory pathway M-ring protein FliF/YscJ